MSVASSLWLTSISLSSNGQIAEYKSYEIHMNRESGQKVPIDLWHKFEATLLFDYGGRKFSIQDGKQHLFFLTKTLSSIVDSSGTDHIVYAGEDNEDGDSCKIELILFVDPGRDRYNIGYIVVSWDQRQFYVSYKLRKKDRQ